MPETDEAQVSFLWPPLDGIQVQITACVGAEDLALHTYPVPSPEAKKVLLASLVVVGLMGHDPQRAVFPDPPDAAGVTTCRRVVAPWTY
jgi:hypothetical protein